MIKNEIDESVSDKMINFRFLVDGMPYGGVFGYHESRSDEKISYAEAFRVVHPVVKAVKVYTDGMTLGEYVDALVNAGHIENMSNPDGGQNNKSSTEYSPSIFFSVVKNGVSAARVGYPENHKSSEMSKETFDYFSGGMSDGVDEVWKEGMTYREVFDALSEGGFVKPKEVHS